MSESRVEAYIAQLKDEDPDICYYAAEALGDIGDASAVPALIEELKYEYSYVRGPVVAEALGKIGVPAVPALIEALKDGDAIVRYYAAKALGEIGDASAIPALMEALNDKDLLVRFRAATWLGPIGEASAIPVLIEALRDKNPNIRSYAAAALGKMGDSVTLPRKILAASHLSAEKRIDILDALRRVSYKDRYRSVRYKILDIRSLCKAVLGEGDAEAHAGAQTVLNWLNGDRDLVIASQRDFAAEAQNLLRAAQSGMPETSPDTLLRAFNEQKENTEPPYSPPVP